MKTNEFIKEAESMGFEVKISFGWLGIYSDGLFVSKVSENHIFSVDTNTIFFDRLEETKKQQLFNLLTEYASTPIEEREEEKKYMYRVKGKVEGINLCSNNYLNRRKGTKRFCISDSTGTSLFQTTFTHSELKSLGVDIEQLQEVYEEIEVEE